MMRYRASKLDCESCSFETAVLSEGTARKIPRSSMRALAHGARHRQDRGVQDLAMSAQKVEMLFAHLKRILKLDRLRLRGPNGAATNSTSPPPPKTSAKWPC